MGALDWHIKRGQDDLPDLLAALGRMDDLPPGVLEDGAREMKRVLQESYPPVQLPRPRQEMTPKARRTVAMLIRLGKITVPYRRTGKLARGWDVAAEGLGKWHVRNLTTYAIYVQGGRQSGYMQLLGWKKVGAVYKQHAERVRAAMRRAIVRRWSKRTL